MQVQLVPLYHNATRRDNLDCAIRSLSCEHAWLTKVMIVTCISCSLHTSMLYCIMRYTRTLFSPCYVGFKHWNWAASSIRSIQFNSIQYSLYSQYIIIIALQYCSCQKSVTCTLITFKFASMHGLYSQTSMATSSLCTQTIEVFFTSAGIGPENIKVLLYMVHV